MREEARALRAGAADDAPSVYFVSLMPRAEFATEAAMATTLRDAGMVPSGSLMVRQPPRAAPAAAQGGAGGEEEEGEEAGEEEEEEEEQEQQEQQEKQEEQGEQEEQADQEEQE